MKNGIEIRPNGVRIIKKPGDVFPLYYVEGSKDNPWDFLSNARINADALIFDCGNTKNRCDESLMNIHFQNVNYKIKFVICELNTFCPESAGSVKNMTIEQIDNYIEVLKEAKCSLIKGKDCDTSNTT